MNKGIFKLQFAVFALVSASFTNIYLTQPVLPVIQNEFGVNPVQVSLTVSAVIFGIVLSNLFFGFLSDRFPIHPIVLSGGLCVAAGGLVSALTHNFAVLIAARMFQGIFIPALTTSLAAWMARTQPGKQLGVIMGSYVSATVLGGLGGRLLGGWIGITGAGFAFQMAGWEGVIGFVMCFLVIPIATGFIERKRENPHHDLYR